MSNEEIQDEIEEIIRKDIEVSDGMTSLIQERNHGNIEEAAMEVLTDVVPSLDNKRRKLVALLTCKNIAEKTESEELHDMCVGNIQRWMEKYGDK